MIHRTPAHPEGRTRAQSEDIWLPLNGAREGQREQQLHRWRAGLYGHPAGAIRASSQQPRKVHVGEKEPTAFLLVAGEMQLGVLPNSCWLVLFHSRAACPCARQRKNERLLYLPVGERADAHQKHAMRGLHLNYTKATNVLLAVQLIHVRNSFSTPHWLDVFSA